MSDAPVGVYIHIPFCKSKCKYCAFVSSPNFSLMRSYIDALTSEIDSYSRGCDCDTVYIGGGTPSCLPRGALSDIFSAIKNKFKLLPGSEITVECNPESVSREFIDECLSCGVNRVSMGLQSSDDNVLKNIGRIHTYAQYLNAVKLLSASFENISSDIILGLPGQTADDVERAIDTVTQYCSHLSVYALTVEDGTPLAADGYCPDDDLIADMYELAYNKLKNSGFDRYEVSNFARDGKQSGHNLKYWRNMPYVGFGVAAHGYDGSTERYEHGNDIVAYLKCQTPETIKLSEKDKYNEYIMLALRTERGIDLCDFERVFGYSFLSENTAELQHMASSGYIDIADGFLRISPKYLFVMNGIIEALMED